jgi:hypothetical protein
MARSAHTGTGDEDGVPGSDVGLRADVRHPHRKSRDQRKPLGRFHRPGPGHLRLRSCLPPNTDTDAHVRKRARKASGRPGGQRRHAVGIRSQAEHRRYVAGSCALPDCTPFTPTTQARCRLSGSLRKVSNAPLSGTLIVRPSGFRGSGGLGARRPLAEKGKTPSLLPDQVIKVHKPLLQTCSPAY